MNLGLEHGINRLSPYSADWPGLFTTEAENILSVCGNCIIAIEHVGSTSIPHMEAKPIVDMVAGVASLNDAEKMIKGMESIGYDYPGDIGIPDDRIFVSDYESTSRQAYPFARGCIFCQSGAGHAFRCHFTRHRTSIS